MSGSDNHCNNKGTYKSTMCNAHQKCPAQRWRHTRHRPLLGDHLTARADTTERNTMWQTQSADTVFSCLLAFEDLRSSSNSFGDSVVYCVYVCVGVFVCLCEETGHSSITFVVFILSGTCVSALSEEEGITEVVKMTGGGVMWRRPPPWWFETWLLYLFLLINKIRVKDAQKEDLFHIVTFKKKKASFSIYCILW